MAEVCYGVVSDGETTTECVPRSRAARKRRMEIRWWKFIGNVSESPSSLLRKRQRLDSGLVSEERKDAVEVSPEAVSEGGGKDAGKDSASLPEIGNPCPRFGSSSLCGRRREMEDALSTVPELLQRKTCNSSEKFHFFGVFDGHGCSHVALSCKDRMYHLVAEELDLLSKNSDQEFPEWKEALERSFLRMDKEVTRQIPSGISCRCEVGTPQQEAVGSTAVVAVVTSHQIAVANCGNSRAVLCRNGAPITLSSDHKPDRPDELLRIQEAGGRVIFWDCPRVLGVLAMSRAIGDNYLKPYVTSVPEVTVTTRTEADECLILASDGLWDVMTSEEVCSVASRCLGGTTPAGCDGQPGGSGRDPTCTVAATLLTRMALVRLSADNVSVVVVDLRRNTSSSP